MRIVVTESGGFSTTAATLLRGRGELILADLDRDGLLAEAARAEVLWVRLRHRIDAGVLAHAPRLKVLATPTTGLTHIDVDEVGRRGVQLVSLAGEKDFLSDVWATAEHTLLLMLALARHLPAAVAHVARGGWDRDRFCGSELRKKTIALVGYGRLGRQVGHLLLAFGARVLACDPAVAASDVEPGVTLLPLDAALGEADLVSLHVSFREENRAMFGARELGCMRPGALLVNTARGELVDEIALAGALSDGHLAGAALDVLANEDAAGMSSHPLVVLAGRKDNVIITPHLGGCTFESMRKTEEFLAKKLCAALSLT